MQTPGSYLDDLQRVVSFLTANGFQKAHETLLLELKDQTPLDLDEALVERQASSALSAPISSDEYLERFREEEAAPRSKSASATSTWEGFPEPKPSSDPGVALSALAGTAALAKALSGASPSGQSDRQEPAPAQPPRRPRRHTSHRHSAGWDTDVDEYDNMDDVGYQRKDVVGQARFTETELEAGSEDGSERNYFMHAPGAGLAYESDTEEVSASYLESMPAPSTSTSVPHNPLFGLRDESWDSGPRDIKFAEPVTTPSKSPEKSEGGTKPVLSRVESLSSSFKDFEMERGADDDQLLSSKVSESEYNTGPVVIDFDLTVAAKQPVLSHEDLDFVRARHSRTSSLDVTPESGSMTSESPEVEKEKVLPKLSVLKGPRPTRHQAKENGGAPGGFSFPVTPPSEEPDSKLFKSWPSVRSSCASELHAASDDDNTLPPADYADDDYSRSKLSSRSTSMHNVELRIDELAVPASMTANDDEWEFHSRKAGPAESSREPSLDFPQEQKDSHTSSTAAAEATASGAAAVAATGEPPATTGNLTSPFGGTEDLAPASSGVEADTDGADAEATDPDAGPLPPANLPDVVAHMINLTVDDLREHDNDQLLGGRSTSDLSSMQQEEAQQPAADADDERSEDDLDDEMIDEQEEGDAEAAQAWVEAEELPEELKDMQDMQGMQEYPIPLGPPYVPRYTIDEQGMMVYEWDPEYLNQAYETFDLRIIHGRNRTGFEETKDFPIRMNDLIAGRYQVMDFLGSAAFSRAVQALDIKTNMLVCLKIIKNNKDYFDQSLDEIKLLKFVNTMDPADEYAVVRLYDFFYYKEHLFLVCELLRANLYEFQKYNKESGDELYFTNARIQKIARQCLGSLAFLHSMCLIHSDLKPENILIKSYSRCEVKVIDLGSSCFISDQLSSYVQSRSYRAPEVILGLPYEHKVDIWSLGCILAELSSGYVLFQNDSLATLLARLEGILGPLPDWMLAKGRYAHRFYTRSGQLYERNPNTSRYETLIPKKSSLRHRMPDADEGLLGFVAYLLNPDPRKRPSAAEALHHPWFQMEYPQADGADE